MRRALLLLLLLAGLSAVAALAGCGGRIGEEEGGRRGGLTEPLIIGLDFTPNAVHSPIYAARRQGFAREHGVRIQIRKPGQGPDSLKLLLAKRVDVAILDIHDLGLARERGADVVAIAALVDRPLAAIVAAPDIRRPRELEGKRVGVSGLPSDPAVLRPVVEQDGGDFGRVRQVTIGFNAVPSLLSKKVAAVPAFRNVEGVLLERRGFDPRIFPIEDYGAPRYPEVVAVVRRESLKRRPSAMRGFVESLQDGVESVREEPEPAIKDVAHAAGADRPLIAAQLKAVEPALNETMAFDRGVLDQWAAFDARFGILKRKPDVGKAFALDVAPKR